MKKLQNSLRRSVKLRKVLNTSTKAQYVFFFSSTEKPPSKIVSYVMIEILAVVRTRSHVYQEDQTTNDSYENKLIPIIWPSQVHAQSVWKKSYLNEFISEK